MFKGFLRRLAPCPFTKNFSWHSLLQRPAPLERRRPKGRAANLLRASLPPTTASARSQVLRRSSGTKGSPRMPQPTDRFSPAFEPWSTRPAKEDLASGKISPWPGTGQCRPKISSACGAERSSFFNRGFFRQSAAPDNGRTSHITRRWSGQARPTSAAPSSLQTGFI